LPVVKECLSALIYEDERDKKKNIVRPDCNKIFTHPDGLQVCAAYENPANKWRLGCALASNAINIEDEKARVRIGQQKQNKRKK
jgi:hypothetical protein